MPPDSPTWTPSVGEQLEIGQEPPVPPPRREGVAEGQRRRDRGQERAALASWSPWRRKFEAAVAQLAATGRTFTSDDVLAICGEPLVSGRNSVGGLMAAAAKRGLIECVGVETSGRPSRNAGLIRTWRGTG